MTHAQMIQHTLKVSKYTHARQKMDIKRSGVLSVIDLRVESQRASVDKQVAHVDLVEARVLHGGVVQLTPAPTSLRSQGSVTRTKKTYTRYGDTPPIVSSPPCPELARQCENTSSTEFPRITASINDSAPEEDNA